MRRFTAERAEIAANFLIFSANFAVGGVRRGRT
jgi:hypothetical protein